MKLVHRFVVSFFENPECFEAPSKTPKFEVKWFSKIRFFESDGVKSVFIEKQRLYDSFQWWRKSSGQSLNAKMSTFIDGLNEIGIDRTRRTVDTNKMTGFVFQAPYIRQKLKTYYKIDSIRLDWCWIANPEFSEYSKREWRFRMSGQ